jgi:hypothetical protein
MLSFGGLGMMVSAIVVDGEHQTEFVIFVCVFKKRRKLWVRKMVAGNLQAGD